MMSSVEYMIFVVKYMIKTAFCWAKKNDELCIKNRTT